VQDPGRDVAQPRTRQRDRGLVAAPDRRRAVDQYVLLAVGQMIDRLNGRGSLRYGFPLCLVARLQDRFDPVQVTGQGQYRSPAQADGVDAALAGQFP
jgi:hypothetical protein